MIDPYQVTFVDTAGIITVLDRTAPLHHFIGEVWRFEIDARSTLLTTDYTIVKAALLLQRHHGLAGIEQLFRVVVPALRVERCTQWDVDVAVASLLASADPGRDLVSHVEEGVKRRLRVSSDVSGK